MRLLFLLIPRILSMAIRKRGKETGRSYREQARIAMIIGMLEISHRQGAENLTEYIGNRVVN